MEKMVRSYDDKRCWRYTGNGMSYLSLYVFSNIGYLSISDIDIEPGVKEARFICPDGETAVVFFLEKCMKQFPDIEKIYIGSGVKSLHFSNFIKNRAENPIRRSDNISCQAVGWGRMRVRLYRIVSAFFYFRFRFVYFLFGLSGFSIPCSLIYSSNVSMLAPPVVDRK